MSVTFTPCLLVLKGSQERTTAILGGGIPRNKTIPCPVRYARAALWHRYQEDCEDQPQWLRLRHRGAFYPGQNSGFSFGVILKPFSKTGTLKERHKSGQLNDHPTRR